MLEIIITKEELYDKCENVEQLYDGFYYPLLVEYKGLKKQLEVLQQENQKYKEVIDKAIEYLDDWLFNVGGLGACMDYKDIKEILDILKEVE